MKILFCCILVVLAVNCRQSHATVCSLSRQQRYTTSCGFMGWDRCNRYRSSIYYQCCSGWTGSTSSGCPSPICFGRIDWCPNGGDCSSPDNCINCNRGFYSPRCDQCTAIANCLEVFCSTSSNHKCYRCDGDYGSALGSAYKKSDDMRQCVKQCSWRSDSNACYPGSCTDAQCTCSSGFSGTDCRTMGSSQAPVLSEHRATLSNGTATIESPTAQSSTDTVYTNFQDFASLRVHWYSSYQPIGLPNYRSGSHPYIHSIGLGVVGARVTTEVHRGQSVTYSIGPRDCTTSTTGNSFSKNRPATDLVSCTIGLDLDYDVWTPASGDILQYDVNTTSGGYVKLFDRDNSNSTITRYYAGRTTTGSSTFTFDFDEPYHCVDVGSGCQKTMLDTQGDVTTQETITVSWQDWVDDLAGIKEYDLQVRQLSDGRGNEELTEKFDHPAVYSGVARSGENITFPDPGVYSVVLSAVDNAANVKLSRRFVFFDNGPDDVTTLGNSSLRVTSATADTDYTWLTELDSGQGGTTVQLDWTAHFINERHHNGGWLKPIGPYAAGTIDPDYDQNFGRRGRAAVPNALGVTEFRVTYDIDHSGGRNTVNVSDDDSAHWSSEGTNTQATYNLTLVDGDSIRFWVEARDLVGHFVRDSVLVHADSSPPVIEDLSSVPKLAHISVQWATYDAHSGVKTMEWLLFDNHTGTPVQHDGQAVPARKVNNEDCDPDTCVCVPVDVCYVTDYEALIDASYADSNFDYFVTLTVTSHAGLTTSRTIKIKSMVTADNVEQTVKFLAAVTNDTSVDEDSVASVADILDDIVNIQDTSPEVTANVVKVVNNLLQVDTKNFNNTTSVANSSSRVVQALEKQISNVLAAGKNISEITTSVAVVAMRFHPNVLGNGVGFAAVSVGDNSTSLADEDIDVFQGSEEEIPLEEVEASIKLPAEILKNYPQGSAVPISFVMYDSSNLFHSRLLDKSQSSNSPQTLGSRIISASVLNTVIRDLPPESPVVAAFNLQQVTGTNANGEESNQCVFWDFSLRDGIGDWSTEGCRKGSAVNRRTVCMCDHATNFAVLVNIHGQQYASFALDFISKLGCCVSIVALIVTILIYSAIRSLRSKTASRILLSFCVSLLLLYLVFVAGVEKSSSSRAGCITAAVLMHYFTLTSMAWMGVEAVNLYLKLVRVFDSHVQHFVIKASILAWGFPAVVIIVILAVDYEAYDNEHSCFLKPGAAFYYSQLLIIGIIFLFNAVVFVLVLRKLICSASKETSDGSHKRAKILRRLQNMASVSVLLGLTWVFGLLSVFEASSSVFLVIFAVVNSLQGLLIFLLFVVRQKKVREHVRNLVRGNNRGFSESSTVRTGKYTANSSMGEGSSGQDLSTKSMSSHMNKYVCAEDVAYEQTTFSTSVSDRMCKSESDENDACTPLGDVGDGMEKPNGAYDNATYEIPTSKSMSDNTDKTDSTEENEAYEDLRDNLNKFGSNHENATYDTPTFKCVTDDEKIFYNTCENQVYDVVSDNIDKFGSSAEIGAYETPKSASGSTDKFEGNDENQVYEAVSDDVTIDSTDQTYETMTFNTGEDLNKSDSTFDNPTYD